MCAHEFQRAKQVSSDYLKCSPCLQKNRSCSISAEREFAELVEAHRSLNIQIDQARERLENACANVGVASKKFNSLKFLQAISYTALLLQRDDKLQLLPSTTGTVWRLRPYLGLVRQGEIGIQVWF